MSQKAPIYELPPFLEGKVTLEKYRKWLKRKAVAHAARDRKRGNKTVVGEQYRKAIHEAIKASKGIDAYTGKPLDWTLIGTYDNETAKVEKRKYREKYMMLPTVDHVDDGLGAPNFKICAQATNDCKSHLSHKELIQFCRDVIEHHQNMARGPGNP